MQKHKGYANIAHSIGRGIQRRTSLEDRLPGRLLDLLDRLRERDDGKPRLTIEQAPTQTGYAQLSYTAKEHPPKRVPPSIRPVAATPVAWRCCSISVGLIKSAHVLGSQHCPSVPSPP